MSAVFTVCGLAALAFAAAITLFLCLSGIPAIREIGFFKFILGKEWNPTGRRKIGRASCRERV